VSGVLIHIGYPRAGSKFLQQWFQQHPAFHYEFGKIGGFSHVHEICKYAQKAQTLFEYHVISCEDFALWRGDMNIVGLQYMPYDIERYQEQLCETLNGLFPHGRILIVTRGFASALKSIYAHYSRSGGILSFSQFQEQHASLLARFFDYNRIILLYRQHFGLANVLTVPFELLSKDPEKFIEQIEKSLGIKEHFVFTRKKINASLDEELLATYRKISNLIFRLIAPFSPRIQYGVYGLYLSYINKNKMHPIVKLISKYSGKVTAEPPTERTLGCFAGRADILKSEGLYLPYWKEYLIT